MGLSIGWQPETLCMFVSGYVRVRKLSHVWMCYCVSVGVEQFETDKLKDIWGVCVYVCQCCLESCPCIWVLSVKGWRNEALNYLAVWVSSSVWQVLLMSSELFQLLPTNTLLWIHAYIHATHRMWSRVLSDAFAYLHTLTCKAMLHSDIFLASFYFLHLDVYTSIV